ncbi:MAG: phosphatidate cytidylyltransferase [Acetobacteraceae bacterium]
MPDTPSNRASHPASLGSSRWSDLTRRLRTALVLLPVALLCVWVGGYAFLLLVAVACLLLVSEWTTMCGRGITTVSGFAMMTVIAAAAVCGGLGLPAIGLLLVLAGTVAAAMGAGFNLALGFPYLGLAAVAVSWLRADPDAGLANTLFILTLIWASDVGAYMIGRLVGGKKMVPSISPGKTWSGAAGGLLCAVLAGLAAAACLSSGYSPSHVVALTIVLGIISQAGDLLESALKRHFGVKDSGSIIPGHGGLLDRLDALLAVAPVAALLALTAGRGVVLWR